MRKRSILKPCFCLLLIAVGVANAVSVRDFGAVGDGVTDDTAAFEAAFAGSETNLYIDPGTYLLGSGGATPLVMPAGMHMHGEGGSSVLRVKAGTEMLFDMGDATTLDSFMIDGDAGATSSAPHQNGLVRLWRVSNVVITNVDFVDVHRSAILTDHVTDLDVVDCAFTNVGMATSYVFSDRINTINCNLVNADRHGFQFWNQWETDGVWTKDGGDFLFSGNTITNGGAGAIWGAGAKRVVMTGNYIDGCRDVGLDPEFCDNVIITNNIVKNARYGGIAAFYSCESVLIENNTVYNTREFSGAHYDSAAVGIWLVPKNTSHFPDDVGYSDFIIRNNEVILPEDYVYGGESSDEIRRCILIGAANENIRVYRNTLDAADPLVWYNRFHAYTGSDKYRQVDQPVVFKNISAGLWEPLATRAWLNDGDGYGGWSEVGTGVYGIEDEFGPDHFVSGSGNYPVFTNSTPFGYAGNSALWFEGGTGGKRLWIGSIDETGLENRSALTIAAWVHCGANTYDGGATLRPILGSPQNYGLVVHEQGTGIPSKLAFVYRQSGQNIEHFTKTTDDLADGWHHIAATFDAVADEVVLYIDGVQDGAARSALGSGDLDYTAYAFWMGGDDTGGNFEGAIDECRVEGKVLTPIELGCHASLVSPVLIGDAVMEHLPASNELVFSWNTDVWAIYTVQSKSDLQDSDWIDTTPDIDGNGGMITVSNTISGAKGFFRIAKQWPAD